MENLYLAALQMVPGIGSSRIKSLEDYFGSARQAWLADRRDLFLSKCLDNNICNNLIGYRDKIDIYHLADQWDKQGIKICSLKDDNYPALLRNTFNPPQVLFYRGTLPANDKMIAVVGSRRASAYGKNIARLLAAELAGSGVGIVSGAARGIDSSAHQGALEKGYTVAVLGSGVDICYPPENAKMIARIEERGAVVSEYAPGTKASPGHFPARNRIINGMALGVIIVEAAERSGALITADFALEEGRDVFAVPGSVFSETSRGTHWLIKQGAKLVDTAGDVLKEYGWDEEQDDDNFSKPPELLEEEKIVYSLLNFELPMGIEEIVIKTKLSPSTVAYILMQLGLRGLTVEHSGQRYIRAAREGIR
ncbi:MAG TPA: DNA-processing protein DprA [Methylomusa anaerophila]|uniref:DprA winged helix domain-containing protein n=1 Tax=Methylomusa anaerophila TaxID=1930071 RepID=A0A348AQ51_9FIRM|nr:DNA-processing protein DprA [Methylomusa anaerophila]BBB93199.1 hypothetical protein MAMMFC1_03908 [Methylomusa anaerophila]HML86969.1 DNA-processing protein DprA [Methylomusa anaerophila]